LTGDRTVGLAGIVTLALIQTLIGNRKKKIKFSQYALLVGAAVVVMYLMSFAFQFRMQQDSKVSGLQTAVVEMIGTLGFSFFPLVLTIRIVP
ncbi:O-antigen polysaccharide polymerase Wzy family protein, partial [Streptococcus pneumoniae]|nr:O-antigen polysaccharide polymerase Wzy family protein [Streptococcus pneumoniae]